MELDLLKKKMEEIAGAWNGDESGLQEDRAHAALDVIKAVNTIEENLLFLREN